MGGHFSPALLGRWWLLWSHVSHILLFIYNEVFVVSAVRHILAFRSTTITYWFVFCMTRLALKWFLFPLLWESESGGMKRPPRCFEKVWSIDTFQNSFAWYWKPVTKLVSNATSEKSSLELVLLISAGFSYESNFWLVLLHVAFSVSNGWCQN